MTALPLTGRPAPRPLDGLRGRLAGLRARRAEARAWDLDADPRVQSEVLAQLRRR